MTARRACAVALLCGLALGCQSELEDDAADGIADTGEAGEGAGECEPDERLGHRSVRRLTRVEFEATVRHVFDLDANVWPGSQLNPDASHDGYNTNAEHLTIDETYAANLLASAEQIADVVAEPKRLATLLPCAGTSPDDVCAESFLDVYGRRLFRRALTSDERARWLAVFAEADAEGGFEVGIRWLVVGLLGSPNFVYRHEIGGLGDDGVYTLAGHEIATALAYTYTGRGPDDALIALAESGGLDTPEQVDAAARALVLSESASVRPQFVDHVFAFADQWLGLAVLPNLQKDETAVPGFTPEVRAAMVAETRAYLAQIVFVERGSVADLLTAPMTMLDGTLADYYGFGQGTPGTFAEVERPPEWGVGLLAQGSLLSLAANNRTTSPTHRGLLVQDTLLCFRPPPPPPDVADIPEPTPEMSTRERYELHTTQDSCAGCHVFMDATGFALEHLDAGGRYRAMEGTHAIDASGELHGHSDDPLTFDGQTQLALTVADLPRASACVAWHVGAYSFGVTGTEAACMVEEPAAQLASDDISVLEFWIRLSTTEHFLRRVD